METKTGEIMADKKTYKVNGAVYEIAPEEAKDFLADFPDAKEVQSFVVDKDTFDIAIEDVDEFLADMPNAKPLKKKEQSEIAQEPSAQIASPVSEEPSTSSELESPSPSQGWEPFDNSLTKLAEEGRQASLAAPPLAQPEPQEEPAQPETASGLGEWVTGTAGAFNKALAKVFTEMDWLQTTVGDAATQVILGKEAANTAMELREKGISVNSGIRPFKSIADALEYTSSGTKPLPETIGGQVVGGIVGIAPDIIATAMMPEVKMGKVIADLGIKTASKFGLVIGARGAVESAEQNQSSTPQKQITAPILAATEGYLTGMVFDNMGVLSHNIGNQLAQKIIPEVKTAAGVVNRQLIAQPTSVLANALMFGGYGTGQELLETGNTSSNTFFVNAGMGVALGATGVAKVLYAKGLTSFVATPNSDISRMSKVDITPQDLIDNGIRKAETIERGESKNPEADIAAASLNINTGINKAFVEEVKANPEGVKKGVSESSLDPKMKETIIDKIDDLITMEDPKAQEAKPYSDEVKFIDQKIESLKKNKSLSSVEKDLQVQDLNTRKAELTSKITDIYKPKDETKQEQAPEVKTGQEEKTAPKEEVEKKPTITSAEGLEKINYTIRESDNKFVVELRDEITDKLIPVKLKEFEAEANQKLEAERTKIIDDIRAADTSAKKGGDFVDYNGNRYKVIKGRGGDYSVMSYTQRVNDRPSRVTNKAIKDAVLAKWNQEAGRLSDIQMREYDKRVDEYKKVLQEEIDAKVRGYENERRSVVLKESDKPVFREGTETAPKEGDSQKGIEERKELPSEQSEHAKKVIDEWTQFKKELQIEEKASKAGAKENKRQSQERADKLISMVSVPKRMEKDIEQEAKDSGLVPGSKEFKAFVKKEMKERNPFNNDFIPNKVHQMMLRKASEASLSDAKYRSAVEYIDKALTDAEFVKYEAEKADLIDNILSVSSDKKIYKKQGKRPTAKSNIAVPGDAENPNIDKLLEINDYIQEGRSKKVEDPNQKILDNEFKAEQNQTLINKILDQKSASKQDMKEVERLTAEIESLKEENSILDFANVRDMDTVRLREKLEEAKELLAGQKSKSKEAKEKRVAETMELLDNVIPEIGAEFVKESKEGVISSMGKDVGRKWPTLLLENANLVSLNNIIMRGSDYKSGEMPIFDDRLNTAIKDGLMNASKIKSQRQREMHEEWTNALKEIYGTQNVAKIKRMVADLQGTESVRVTLKQKMGGKKENNFTPAEAMQKIFQWRSADGRRSMEKITHNKAHRMGYTQKTIDSMIEQLTPQELKVMTVLENLMNKYSEIYDKAWIKENNVSMRVVDDFYWPLHKFADSAVKEEIGSYVDLSPNIKRDRATRRTKDSSPLKTGSAIDDLMEFIDEAIHYEAWARPLREMQYIYKNPTFRAAVSNKFGYDSVKFIDTALKSMAGNLYADRIKWIDKASNAYVSASLGFGISPVINQVAASGYYFADMTPGYFALAVAKMAAPVSTVNRGVRKILKNHEFVKERLENSQVALGNEVNTISESVTKQGANVWWEKKKTIFPVQKIIGVGSEPLRRGDLVPIVSLGSSYVEYKYREHSGKSLTTDVIDRYNKGDKDPALERAISDWEWFSTLSQQSMREWNRSGASMLGGMARAASTYQSGPLSGHRLASFYYRDFIKAQRSGNKINAKKALHGMIVAHAVSGAIFGLVDYMINGADDESWVKSVATGAALGNLEGLFVIGKFLNGIMDSFTNKPWAKKTALQLIPFIDNVAKITDSSKKLFQLHSATVKDEQSIYEEWVKWSVGVSMFTGIGVKNIMRDVRAMIVAGTETKKGAQQDIDVHEVMKTIFTKWREGKYEKSIFLPDEEAPVVFKSFDQAKEAAKSYMAFNEGPTVHFLDKFRKDREGTFSIYTDGLKEFGDMVFDSGFDPAAVISAAYRDKQQERLGRKYKFRRGLNTMEELDELLDNPESTMSAEDQRKFIELKREWQNKQEGKERALVEGERAIIDVQRNAIRATEKELIEK